MPMLLVWVFKILKLSSVTWTSLSNSISKVRRISYLQIMTGLYWILLGCAQLAYPGKASSQKPCMITRWACLKIQLNSQVPLVLFRKVVGPIRKINSDLLWSFTVDWLNRKNSWIDGLIEWLHSWITGRNPSFGRNAKKIGPSRIQVKS